MMSNRRGFAALAAAVALVTSVSGCGGGGVDDAPSLHAVSGVVTHKGSPLSSLVVHFAPVDRDVYSTGATDEAGYFKLQYTMNDAGAVAGENIVYVTYQPSSPEEQGAAAQPNFKPPAPYDAVIAKYGDKATSPYKVTIDGDVDNLEVKLD